MDTLSKRIAECYGVAPSRGLQAYLRRPRAIPGVYHLKPRTDYRRIGAKRPAEAIFARAKLRDLVDVVGALTGALPLGRDGSGNEYLVEVDPERSTLFVLDTAAQVTRIGALARSSGRSPVLARWRRAEWLAKLLVGLPSNPEPWRGRANDAWDAMYLAWQACLLETPDRDQALRRADACDAGVTRDAARWLRTKDARALRAKLPAAPGAVRPLNRAHGVMLEALAGVRLPPRLAADLAAAATNPTTTVLDRLLEALRSRSSWATMLAVADMRLTLYSGIFYPWLQRGLALQRLGRLEEARTALARARRLHPRHPDVLAAVAEVEALALGRRRR
jgi:hypothetical protein